MVEHLHSDQIKCRLDSHCHSFIRRRRRSNTRGMVVGQDDRRGITCQGFLNDLARMHLRSIDCPAKQLGVLDQAVMRVKKEDGKHLMITLA